MARKMEPKDINIVSLAAHLRDETAAWKFMEELRWPDGPVCPHCGSVDHAHLINSDERKTRLGRRTYRREWTCQDCKKQFSVLVGTIYESSKVPLFKWLLAQHMMCSNKNGVAALEIKRTLNVAYKTAWFICHRIRYAMEGGPLHDALLQGVVEADETWVGGVKRGRTAIERARGRLDNKTAVVTLVERGGQVRSRAFERVNSRNLEHMLSTHVDPSATLMTDERREYTTLGRTLAAHKTVSHRAGEYARGDAHINTAEGYFGQLKRSIDGTHHHVSRRHLNRYLSEFDFRYNTRKMSDGERTITAVRQAKGKRLMYDKVVRDAKS